MGNYRLPKTSVFGRFGGTLLRPLRDRINRRPYVAKLSTEGLDILRWWVELLRGGISGIGFLKSPRPEVVIYTDAATSNRIVAALVIDVGEIGRRMEFRTLRVEVPDPKRGGTFILTTYNYGLEILAILATLFLDADYLRGGMLRFTSTILIAGMP